MPAGYANRTELTVSVTSTSPFEKTISGKILLFDAPVKFYLISDNAGDLAMELTMVFPEDDAGAITVSWDPSIFYVNNADNQVINATVTTVSGADNRIYALTLTPTTIWEGGSGIAIEFFKATPANDYSITEKTPIPSGGIVLPTVGNS